MDIVNKLFTAGGDQVRQCMHQHVEFMIECAYYSPKMLGFSAATIALAACALAADRLKMPDACLDFIPDMMWTNHVMEAKSLLNRCFNKLRYEQDAPCEETVVMDVAVDRMEVSLDPEEETYSPTNVMDAAMRSFSVPL
jgi:hypothetical protein